jgi:hypothetical protein
VVLDMGMVYFVQGPDSPRIESKYVYVISTSNKHIQVGGGGTKQ